MTRPSNADALAALKTIENVVSTGNFDPNIGTAFVTLTAVLTSPPEPRGLEWRDYTTHAYREGCGDIWFNGRCIGDVQESEGYYEVTFGSPYPSATFDTFEEAKVDLYARARSWLSPLSGQPVNFETVREEIYAAMTHGLPSGSVHYSTFEQAREKQANGHSLGETTLCVGIENPARRVMALYVSTKIKEAIR